jgi:hypothetical protein|tara:strand:- start:4260 stop:4433 length:174 start_codon:yes stop_codon:yes gene_type:complete
MLNLKKMDVTDIKVYALTVGALATSMTDIDVVLKIIATLVAIGYTLHKWYIMHGKNK